MNREDMLKALDLDASPAPQGAGAIQIETQASAGPVVPQSPNATVLDRWTRRQGRQLRDAIEQDDRIRPIHSMDAVDLADLHLSVFDPSPELVAEGECSDPQKLKYFQELTDTPGFHALRESTILDDAMSELAIERLSEGLATIRDQTKDDPKSGNCQGPDGDDDIAVGRAAGKAINQAQADVQGLQDARDGLGLGTGPGAGGQLDVKSTLDLYRRLRQSADLQKIINLAGKYRLFGQSQQRRKISHGYDDLVGVTVGDDLPRLTQSEFLALGLPELEDDVCRRLLDSQAMVQEWHGQEPVAKGPMIIAIDESGSMTASSEDGNSRICHAKALALAFAYLARQQDRWCALIGWSGCGQRRTIVLPPHKWDHEALITWLSGFLNGGTEPPISDMPEIYRATGAPVGKTDICYITDGTVYIDPVHITGFNLWKKEVNAKVITLVVSADAGQMTQVSDEIHVIKSLGLNDATAKVLSI